MSSILGVFSASGRAADPAKVGRMLAAMANRGAGCSSTRNLGSGTIAAARHEWELDAAHSGPVIVAHDGRVAVAADASLYYRGDLARKLRYRGAASSGDTPSHLILAAYQAWGADCARELEGDFAFVVWDEPARSVFAARDFAGKRPLYFTEAGDTLLLASSLAGLLAHSSCARELDLVVIAEEAAGLTGTASATCWRGIYRVPPGHCLQWRSGQGVRITHYREVPTFADRDDGRLSFDDAAEELRGLLSAAMDERMARSGSTAICLSGGGYSPSLYATGQQLLCDTRHDARALEAISVTVPGCDPGFEDDAISSIVRYWEEETTWVQSAGLLPLADILERAARRDEPSPHLFEVMDRALARTARSLGARVVLDGNGGTPLFHASCTHLTDLFASGRWPSVARDLRALGSDGWRELLRYTLLLSRPASLPCRTAEAREGSPFGSTIERPLPRWIRAPFAVEHSLREREYRNVPARAGRSRAAHESAWRLTRPLAGRTAAALGTLALEEGVEHRSPFTDSRVLDFAASRPVSERRSGGETGWLLRHAMKGLLPDAALTPRPRQTGSQIRHLTRAIVAVMPSLIERTMRDPVLGDLGIIDPLAFRKAWDENVRRGDPDRYMSLYLTMEVELWLRARATHSDRNGGSASKSRPRLAVIG